MKSTSSPPGVFELHQNYPNPFNPKTTISYDLKRSSDVIIQIYNTAGQIIRIMNPGRQNSGHYLVTWDSRNDLGQLATSGIYFYKLKINSFTSFKKMVLLR